MLLPDIHREKPDVAVPVHRVGVTSVKLPLGFLRDMQVMVLPVFEAYIDLPISLKGINASRNYEVITDVLRKRAHGTNRLEEVCVSIAKELLKRHSYATRAESRARGEIIVKKTTPKTRIQSYEPYNIMASAVAVRRSGGRIEVSKSVGVGVTGVTTCPCAQEALKEVFRKQLTGGKGLSEEAIAEVFRSLPVGTHMQRSHGTIFTEVPEGFHVDARQLIRVIEESMSATTYGLLKRPDEAVVVEKALRNPKFAEDCVRYMVRSFVETFPKLQDDIHVSFRLVSMESIHKHNFAAEISDTLGKLRKILQSNAK